MEFALSKQQKMLQSSVRDFLARHCPLERVRELMATATAHDSDLWDGLTDQGWTSMTLPEAYDGLELGAVDLAAVAEAMGRFCMPGPFLSNLWAAELLAGAGNDDLASSVLPDVVDGEQRLTVALLEESASWDVADVKLELTPAADGVHVSGRKLLVPDAETAELLLVIGRLDGQLAVASVPTDGAGVTMTPVPAIDMTRKLYEVAFDGAIGAIVASGEAAELAVHRATRLATVVVCAELLGGMQWVLESTVEYAKTREQFGRVIGAFQAVQHHCADMLYAVESARSAVYSAAWAVSVDDAGADEAVSVAKAYCSDAARTVGNLGVQVHGGIGFTWEHDLNLFYRRAKADEILFGDAGFHRERLATMLLDGSDTTTTEVTDG